jgi:hypothetical protein
VVIDGVRIPRGRRDPREAEVTERTRGEPGHLIEEAARVFRLGELGGSALEEASASTSFDLKRSWASRQRASLDAPPTRAG